MHAEGAQLANGARVPTPKEGSDGGTRVLNDGESVALRDRNHAVHIRGASRPMYRQDGARLCRNRRGELVCVHLEPLVTIHKYGPSANRDDRSYGGVKGV